MSLAPPAGLSKLHSLPQEAWLPRQAAYQARVRRYADPYLSRRSAGRKHPVEDFLFTYYTQKPGQLLRWHPGAGVVLSGPAAAERIGWKYYRTPDDGELAAAGLPAGSAAVTVDVGSFVRDRRDALHQRIAECGFDPPLATLAQQLARSWPPEHTRPSIWEGEHRACGVTRRSC